MYRERYYLPYLTLRVCKDRKLCEIKSHTKICWSTVIDKNATWHWQWVLPVTPNNTFLICWCELFSELEFPITNTSRDMSYFPPFIFPHFWSSPDRQTESDVFNRAHRATSTGGLKNWCGFNPKAPLESWESHYNKRQICYYTIIAWQWSVILFLRAFTPQTIAMCRLSSK